MADTDGRVRQRGRGRRFTLIELLVVIAIIAVLMSMLLSSLRNARDIAMSATCKSNLRQIRIGYESYVDDNDARIPYGAVIGSKNGHYYNATGHNGGGYNLSWFDLLYSYVPNWGIYSCPTKKWVPGQFSYIGACFIFVEVWETYCGVPGCTTHAPGYTTYNQTNLRTRNILYPEQKVLFYDASHYAVGGYNGQIGYYHSRNTQANFMYFNGAVGTHTKACTWAYPGDPAQTHYFANNGYPTQCACANRGW